MSMTSGLVNNHIDHSRAPSGEAFERWLLGNSTRIAFGFCVAIWSLVAAFFVL